VIPGKRYKLSDLTTILQRRWWLIALPCVLAAVATYFIAKRLPNRYRSETLILVVPQRVPETYVKSTVTARIEDRLQSISQQILSRTRLERIIQDFGLYEKARRTQTMEDVVDGMRKDIDVQVIKGDAFRVSFTGDQPRAVMQVTERLASLFIEENLRDRANLAEGSYQFLEAQLEDARQRLIEHDKRLEEYRRRYSGQLPTQLQSNLQVIQSTEMQIQTLTESAARDRDRKLMFERQLADEMARETPELPIVARPPGSDAGDATTTASGSLSQQLEAARQVLRQLEVRLTPEHPDIIRQKGAIARLEKKVAEEAAQPLPSTPSVRPLDVARHNRIQDLKNEIENLDRQLARKDAEEKRLRGVVGSYQTRVEAIPARESELTELMRDYNTLQQQYQTLLSKREESKIAANLERNQIGEQFRILDPARMPEKPATPNRVAIEAVGTFAGFALGLALVVLLELADATFKSEEDVVNALSLPVMALVPRISNSRDRGRSRRRWWKFAARASAIVGAAAHLAAALFS